MYIPRIGAKYQDLRCIQVVVYAGESKAQKSKEVIVAEIFPDYDALGLKE